MRSFAGRLVAAFAVLDVTFKVLVGLAYLMVMGANEPARRHDVLDMLARVVIPTWFVWLAILWLMVRPIERFAVDDRAGRATDAIVRRAGELCARLPARLSLLWAIQWTGAFGAVALLAGPGRSPMAVALFLVALMLGPPPLAHAFVVWFTTPTRRSLDVAAHGRHIQLERPPVTIRGRLTMYALCITLAPSAYMAAIGVGARMQMNSFSAMLIAMSVGFLAVSVYAVLTTVLVSTTLTVPVVDMVNVVRSIAREDVHRLRRVPQHERDELGVLVELTNDMLDRLERTETEREAARVSLEELTRSLEQRVSERTQQLDDQIAQRAKLELEVSVAQRIQTSILPRTLKVEGLDIAAKMVTATEVGGDYYDILPFRGGGWLGIGDVSGHGIGAGLVMLMLQSITATLVDACPSASPRDIVLALNRVLFQNVRQRLRADDFVTLTLLRYDTSGVVRFAGAHEELILWRASTGRCERIDTPGTWVAIGRDIDRAIVEQELRLDASDVLVLYTDGIIESRDRERRQFGIERLCATIEELARDSSVDAIATKVVDTALQWGATQRDDMSILVARKC